MVIVASGVPQSAPTERLIVSLTRHKIKLNLSRYRTPLIRIKNQIMCSLYNNNVKNVYELFRNDLLTRVKQVLAGLLSDDDLCHATLGFLNGLGNGEARRAENTLNMDRPRAALSCRAIGSFESLPRGTASR